METTVCATHPTRRASLTCERCGSFACSECSVDAPWGTSMCSGCKVRGALRYPLAWEQGSPLSPLRFLRSAQVILRDAPTLFSHLPEGALGRALGFCAWIALCLSSSRLLADTLRLRLDWAQPRERHALLWHAGFSLLESLGRTYGLVLISGLVFHMAARAFGGRASFEVALRTAAYGSAFLLYNVGITLVAAIAPFLELPGIAIMAMTQAYFYFTCLSLTGVERYGLPRARAEAAAGFTLGALLPSVVLVTLLFTLASSHVARYADILQLSPR